MSAAGARARSALPALAGLLVALAGSAGYLVVPMVVAALRHAAVPEMWIGLIGSADPAGMFVGTAIALLRAVRSRPRAAALAALVAALAANAGSLAVHDPAWLLGLRLITGMTGGIALAIGLTVIAASPSPDQSFTRFALAQMAFGAVVAWLAKAGLNGLGVIYTCMFAVQVVGLAIALSLPARAVVTNVAAARGRAFHWRLAVYTGLANFCAAAGFLLLWANIHASALAVGVPAGAAVAVFDTGLAGSFIGGLMVLAFDGGKRRRPVTAALFLIGLVSVAAIMLTHSTPVFFAAVFFLQLSTTAAFLGFGAVSEADPGGRMPIIHILAVKAGFGVAPAFASMLLLSFHLRAVQATAFATLCVALLLYHRLITVAEADRDAFRRS